MRAAPLRLVALAALALPSACGGDGAPGAPPEPETEVADVRFESGGEQELLSRRSSSEPFVVRVTDPAGRAVADTIVRFELEGIEGRASQPRAVTDARGRAETFLLDPAPGEGTLAAAVGGRRARLPVTVRAAPGEIRFVSGSGRTGLPGLPHPDSTIAVRVLDTEGAPLADTEVWFASRGRLSEFRDTTDALGRASTVLRRSDLGEGPGTVTAFILGFPEVTARDERPVRAPASRVVLVSVDGLRGDAVERWSPPTLSRLAAEGAFTPEARTVTPSLTVPAHLSLLAGVPPEEHAVLVDDVRFTEEMAALDPLFRHARDRGRTAVAFMSGEGPLAGFDEALRCRQAFGLDSLTLTPPGALPAVESALPALSDPGVGLVFVHVPDPDLAGHEHGWDSPEYGEAVLRADSAVARIVDAARSDSTLFVVVSDHGGGGAYGSHQHGSGSPDDVRIPILLWGSAVEPGSLVDASILDVAPTVLWGLGLVPPGEYEGRVLLEGFGGAAARNPAAGVGM